MLKKIVLVIVEGITDETALGVVLSHVYDKNVVYLQIMRGDITTRYDVTPQNIISKIGNVVKNYAKSGNYKSADFRQIIHIVDTDGAYISDDNIIEDQSLDTLLYEADGIYTYNRQSTILRNANKRANLHRICVLSQIWNVPYSVYYMSCNLDHVLHDKRNSTETEKMQDAYAFAEKYQRDTEGFIKFLGESEFSVKGDFEKSWDYIKEGMHSIERHTNLCICIDAEVQNVKCKQ